MEISSMTHGVSILGARKYVEELQLGAIEKAITALENTSEVKSTLAAGWQGQAETNFEKSMDKSVQTVVEALRSISDGIESLVTELTEDLLQQDRDMVDPGSAVSF